MQSSRSGIQVSEAEIRNEGRDLETGQSNQKAGGAVFKTKLMPGGKKKKKLREKKGVEEGQERS